MVDSIGMTTSKQLRNDWNTKHLVQILRNHYVECHALADGTIRVLEEFTKIDEPGKLYREWTAIPATRKAVRNFLGY
jgi:hypothetical protein